MISFSKTTKTTYNSLQEPVQDRVYFLEDVGQIYLNGDKYGQASSFRSF